MLWATLVVYMLIILTLSSATIKDQGPEVVAAHEMVRNVMRTTTDDPSVADSATPNVEHVILYEGLGVIALYSWSSLVILGGRSGTVLWRWALPLAIALVLVYGAFDEWYQGSISGRTSSAWDLLMDLLGGVMGGVGGLILRSTYYANGILRRWVLAP